LFLSIVYSQNDKTVENTIKQELTDMLVKGNILNSEERNTKLKETKGCWWKKNKAKIELSSDESLRNAILSNYPYPKDGKLLKLNDNYIFKGINISYLGSYLIKDNSKVVTNSFPENSNPPDLPVLISNSQVGLLNPNRDNYNLYSDLTYLVSLDANMEGTGSTPYFDNKAKTALFKSQKNNQTLSVAYGTFNNQLANLFQRCKRQDVINSLELLPLLKLWQLYVNKEVDGKEQIINSFDALSIYRTSKVNLISKTDFTNETNINVSSIPFLNIKEKSNFEWSRKRESSISENTYDIYMIKKPTFETIPSIENILKVWNSFDVPEPFYKPGAKELLITGDNLQNTVKVKFGPVPEYAEKVEIDKEYSIKTLSNKFIKDIKIIKEETMPTSEEDGYYYFTIQFIRDESFYLSSAIAQSSINDNINLKLKIFDSLNKLELSKTYNVNLKTETLPVAYIDSKQTQYDSKDNKNYKIKIYSNFISNTNVSEAVITNIEFKDKSLKLFENEINNMKYRGVFNLPNSCLFDISVPISSNILDNNSQLYSTIKMKIFSNDTYYERLIDFKFPYIQTKDSSSFKNISYLTVDNVKEVVKLLSDSTILSNGNKLSKYYAINKDSSFVYKDIIELLPTKEKGNIIINKNGVIYMSKDIIDKKKFIK